MKPIEKSIYSYLQEYAAECGAKCFVFDEERSYTTKEVLSEVITIGNRLYERGVREGSLVALRCTRSLDTWLIYLALQAMGATAMLIDPHQGVHDFLSRAECRADFVLTNEYASNDISANENWEVSGSALPIGYPARKEERRFPTAVNLHAPATIVFTSGSTGKGKGVMLSQYNIVNHFRNHGVAGCYREDDISIELLPLHHVFGLGVLLMGLVKRYCIFFPNRVNVEYAAECIEKHGVTRLDGVPSFALALAQRHQKTKFCAKSLRVGVIGGAPSTTEQFDFIERELGIQLLPLYGQSECMGITAADETQSEVVRSSTVGKFLPLTEGFILDVNGVEAPFGCEGEICVKGPEVMLGYLNDEEGTKAAIDEQGRLHTGDLGYLDEKGYLHISGRKKDIIIRNGNNISTRKIEKALHAIDGVSLAAVVGVEHEKWGETPCALVVKQNDYTMSEDGLKKELLNYLAKNEIPEKILFADILPLTSSGKPDKQKIKELFKQWKA